MGARSLPVLDADSIRDRDAVRDGRIVGVVLAAGGSRRFGDANKLLTEIDGQPMVRRAIRPFLAVDLDAVFVVVGDRAEAVGDACGRGEFELVRNPDWEAGQSTSMHAGLRAATDANADAVIFGLADMPWIDPESVDLLATAFRRHEAPIIAAAYRGQRGNPVLFTEDVFDALEQVSGDTGGREVILGSGDAVAIETADPGVLRDVDRPDDVVPSDE